jgi:3' terminal RNA ribose 2'-O-methyltransferase Hen1
VRGGSGRTPSAIWSCAAILAHQRVLVSSAVGRLEEVDDAAPFSLDNAVPADDAEPDRPQPLAVRRVAAVLDVLHSLAAHRVVDLGCGEGALLRALVDDVSFTEVLGVDVSHRALDVAARRLQLDRMPDRKRARLTLLQSSLTYRDARLAGFDAVVLMEVIEHVDLSRLPALERTVFGDAQPGAVLVTTPNVEHNVRYESLRAGTMRHRDHRFEWTRAEFADWCATVATAYGYDVRHLPVGDDDPEVGPPTQLAVFTRRTGTGA